MQRFAMSCPVCKGASAHRMPAPPYVQCATCGVVYLETFEPGLLDRRPMTPEVYARSLRHKWPVNRERILWLQRQIRVSPGRAADIGTLDGTAVRVLTDAGWDAIAYDPDPRCRPYAAEQLGVSIRTDFFTPATTEPESLDLVTGFHVIEHIPDPLDLLTTIHRALRQGGYLYLETPSARQIQRRQLTRGHVVLYTAHSLAQTVTAAGFTVRVVTECAPGSLHSYDQLALVAQRHAPPSSLHPWQIDTTDRSVSVAMGRAAQGLFHPWSVEWPPDRSATGLARAALRRARKFIRRGRYYGRW